MAIRTARLWPWFQPPPPAPSVGGSAERLAPGPRFNPFNGHNHVYAGQPFPGSPAFAYEALGLTEFSPIGAGTHNREQWRQAFETSFASNAYWTQGLGGLVQGQYASAPLVVPGTNNVEVEDYGMELLPGQFENWVG